MLPVPLELVVGAVAAFISVGLITGLAISRLLGSRNTQRKRLDKLVNLPVQKTLAFAPGGSLPTTPLPAGVGTTTWLPKSTKQMSQTERRLAQAGFRTAAAAQVFTAFQIAVPVLLAATALVFYGTAERTGWIAGTFAGGVGYLLPGLYLDHAIAQRRKQIKNGLPDVLDLVIICLEAGNSLDQAVVKASEELGLAYPALAEELRVLITETRAGKPRMEAFRNLAQRTKVDDVRAMVAMLIQTDRFGTSVAQALRTLAESMRTARRQAAEERANKVGVKLVFPLVICIFPAFFVVILGGALLRLINSLDQMAR